MTYLKIGTAALVLLLGGTAVYIIASQRANLVSPSNNSNQTTTPSPSPATSPVVTASTNIIVSSPSPNQLVASPLLISGQARVFEGTVSYRVKDQQGKVLAVGTTQAVMQEVGQFGNFQVSVKLSAPVTSTGSVEIYQISAKDGSEIDKVTIPIKFS
jgi:hypothetical protein